MIALIQRVTRASVTVEGEVTGEIGADFGVIASKRMTTNRKQTVCASVCSATASLAMPKAR